MSSYSTQLTAYKTNDGKIFDLNNVSIRDTEKYSAFCSMITGLIDTNATSIHVNEIKIYDICCEKPEYLGDWVSNFRDQMTRHALCEDVERLLQPIIRMKKHIDIIFGFADFEDNPWHFTYNPEEETFTFVGEVKKEEPVSTFLKPVTVSKELCEFLNLDSNEKYNRVTVTKKVCDYIKNNNLCDPNDKRVIVPDEKFKTVLNYKEEHPPLTYFRLQTYLKTHFTE